MLIVNIYHKAYRLYGINNHEQRPQQIISYNSSSPIWN